MNAKESGMVKWFKDAKGYGFIQCDEGRDVFVHYSPIVNVEFRSPSEGQRVEFSVEESAKGPQAQSVYIVNQTVDFSW